MILFVHLLFGAAIGSAVKSIPLAIVLAFLSHYFWDLFPHVEYDIENINKKQWRSKLSVILKITLDFCLGILFILIFSNPTLPAGRQAVIYICALFAILPDGLTVLSYLLPDKILVSHNIFHQKKIHFLKYKKISNFWRIFSQIAAIMISIVLLKI
jgi:hypothetical protein